MKTTIALALVLLAAAAGSARAAFASPICVSTTPAANRPLVVAERDLAHSSFWQAANLCCKGTVCTWVDPLSKATQQASVAPSKVNPTVWLVRVPGHLCYVKPAPAGAGIDYRPRCVLSG